MTNEYSASKGALATIERVAAEKAQTISTVTKDDSNEASFPGFPYKIQARGRNILVVVDLFKSGYECKSCGGKGVIPKLIFEAGSGRVPTTETETCPQCKGKRVLLEMPDESKPKPCTGIVVSIGSDFLNDPKRDIKLYDRVIFGPFSGRFLPLAQAGVVLKTMDEREATSIVVGGDDLSAVDFIMSDKNMEEY